MRKSIVLSITILVCISSYVLADTFAEGTAHQFEIDFVTISGNASSANGTDIGLDKPEGFIDPGYAFRMGVYEITNDQWNKFSESLGYPVTGWPSGAYDDSPYYTGTNVPTNNVSWYEAAQFVNWLNVSRGYHPAYKFKYYGSSRLFDNWESSEAWEGTNLYRHKDAFYFLPTEDEWVKAAYWNGANLQSYATLDDTVPIAMVDTNYNRYTSAQPWIVGSGSEELNGTYDMMGNVLEWTESPYYSGTYRLGYARRGGSSYLDNSYLNLSYRNNGTGTTESWLGGFRVASVIPEPATLLLLGVGALALRKRQ